MKWNKHNLHKRTNKINQYIFSERKSQGLKTETKCVFKNKIWIIFLTKALSDVNEWRAAETHGDGMCQQLTVLMTLVLSVIRSKCLFTYVCEAKHSHDLCDLMPHKCKLGCFQALVLGLLRVSLKSISLSSSFHSNEFHLSMSSLKWPMDRELENKLMSPWRTAKSCLNCD